MHLGNSIICPVTGIPMLIAAGCAAVWAYKKAKKDFSKDNILPTVALTAFVFALQMINFAIPETGSSGHIVGGLLLAALLGPYTGFLAICSILLIQALFFADGGLLALGCNIFNMGILSCFVAYPLLYKSLAERNKPVLGTILASVAALQLGAIAVVAESALSGSTSLNIGLFTSLMQGIHLPIGIVEGIFSAVIILAAKNTQLSKVFSYSLGTAALILAGVISQYASNKPDGLEWSLINLSDSFMAQTQGYIYSISEALQAKTAILTQLPSAFANILGLLVVTVLMLTVCKLLTVKQAQVYEKQ